MGSQGSRLEHRVTLAEQRAKMAEDRAAMNEKLLNSKMLELSKLQSTLTQQTKVKKLWNNTEY